ncbi:MAG: hypothetical protein ACM3P0_03330 [Acidobacteriota bacterium]
MRRFAAMLFVLSLGAFATCSMAQEKSVKTIQHGAGFVDANGDGYNDNAPDHDHDGIPNGQDPDYKGGKMHHGHGTMRGFIDLNGDGINDRALDNDGDGIPNGKDPDFKRPMDGSGRKMGMGKGMGNGLKSGQGMFGNGICDGLGPKGARRGK